jgi:DNA-binding XRE family transcriptional regulator
MPKSAKALLTHRFSTSQPQFAAVVRAGRAVLAWSQTELAKRAGLTQRAIYRIEQGSVQPRLATASTIIVVFTGAGLRFGKLSDGDFKMTVPPKV